MVGNGSFGVVFTVNLLPSNEQVAIKKVLQVRGGVGWVFPWPCPIDVFFQSPSLARTNGTACACCRGPRLPRSLVPCYRFKNREKEIMTQLRHTNIVELLYFFFSNGTKKDEVYLNLVLEFIPETLYTLSRSFSKQKAFMPPFHVALCVGVGSQHGPTLTQPPRSYSYQMYRGLAYIHALGVCHRDIKPQNVLVDATQGVLKLCDFGAAE